MLCCGMDWMPINSEMLTQRHGVLLMALLVHGLCFGGAALLHRFAPLTLPAWLRMSPLHYVVSPWVFRAEDKLNRADREPTKRAWRGGAVLVIVLITSWVMASFATLLLLHVLPSYYIVVLLIALLLPIGPALLSCYIKQTPRSLTVPQSSYPEMSLVDDAHLRRLDIERMARALLETALLLAGFLTAELHGLIAMSLLCALYHSVCVPTTRYHAYGMLIRVLYELLCFIPAIIVTFLTITASFFTPHTAPMAGIRALFKRDTLKKNDAALSYPAFLFRAIAACLKISLGGPYRCNDTAISAPWVGKGTAQLEAHHTRTALIHLAISLFLMMLATAALYQ